MNNSQAKLVLASRLRAAYDDLFLSDKDANTRNAVSLKGWFKTKTGEGESVAEKMASTFKSLANYADFNLPSQINIQENASAEASSQVPVAAQPAQRTEDTAPSKSETNSKGRMNVADLGFVYRLEIHLPDTQNVETFRAIFRALREEMMG